MLTELSGVLEYDSDRVRMILIDVSIDLQKSV